MAFKRRDCLICLRLVQVLRNTTVNIYSRVECKHIYRIVVIVNRRSLTKYGSANEETHCDRDECGYFLQFRDAVLEWASHVMMNHWTYLLANARENDEKDGEECAKGDPNDHITQIRYHRRPVHTRVEYGPAIITKCLKNTPTTHPIGGYWVGASEGWVAWWA